MSTEAIYSKYWAALMDVDAVMVPADTAIVLALRLAVQDAYGEGLEACSGTHDDLAAIVASLQQALQDALDRIDPLREERNALQAQVAILEEELDGRRNSGAAWVAEIDSLRQQLAQMDADNADLLNKVQQAQNVIAVGTLNSLTEVHSNGNGAGVDPTPTPEWSRNHPAWKDFSEEQWVTLYRLHSGDLRFRNLSKDDRIDLVGRVVRHLADGGEPVTGPQFDRLKPTWMPTAGAVVLLAESRKWQDLLNLAAAPV